MRAPWQALLFLLTVGSGCDTDPCAGFSQSCVRATVVGVADELDQLEVKIVDGNMVRATRTPTPPQRFTLPVRVPIVLPPDVTEKVSLTVDGIVEGRRIASSDVAIVTLKDGRGEATIRLGAEIVDPTDMAITPPADLAGADLSLPTRTWTNETAPNFPVLNGVWGAAPNDVYAVAQVGGHVYHTVGDGTWTDVQTAGEDCFAIYGRDANTVWVAGKVGRIFVGNKTTTFAPAHQEMNGGNPPEFHGLWADSQTAVAVGQFGVVVRLNGVTWTKDTFPTVENLTAVSGVGTVQVAVGEQGGVYVYDNGSWTQRTDSMGPDRKLTGVWVRRTAANAALDIWTLGVNVNGTMMAHIDRRVDATLTQDELLTGSFHQAIAGIYDPAASRTLIMATGEGAVVGRSLGNGTWTAESIPTFTSANDQRGAFIFANGEAYSVGIDGAVGHYK